MKGYCTRCGPQVRKEGSWICHAQNKHVDIIPLYWHQSFYVTRPNWWRASWSRWLMGVSQQTGSYHANSFCYAVSSGYKGRVPSTRSPSSASRPAAVPAVVCWSIFKQRLWHGFTPGHCAALKRTSGGDCKATGNNPRPTAALPVTVMTPGFVSGQGCFKTSFCFNIFPLIRSPLLPPLPRFHFDRVIKLCHKRV